MNDNKKIYSDVLNTFVNLIGYITIIIHFDSYSESKNKYEDILNTIVKWMVEYEQKKI